MSGLPTPAQLGRQVVQGGINTVDRAIQLTGLPSPTQAGLHVVQAGLKRVDGALENVSLGLQAVHRAHSKLPDITEDYDESKPDGVLAKGVEAVRAQIKRGLPITADPIKAAAAFEDALGTKIGLSEGLDDRKLALEYLLTFLSRAPPEQTASLEHKAIRTLYYDLPHPPSTHMGPDYHFRTDDGSGNSPFDRNMGASFTPYSRSCTGTRPLPVSNLPDAALVYEALIRRPANEFTPHPAGLSGLFFSFATTVIHSVFRTSRIDPNLNETSSYADLGILYGNNTKQLAKIRYVDGRGKILPDVFAETRLRNLPPAVAAILVVFNRNHNYIADVLLRINERGTWKQDISKLKGEELTKQDYEIFNTARLVNSLTYANVILGDYLAAILGTVRDGSSWTLNIAGERREDNHQLLERGQGNSCSVEFNVLYRLHPSMSDNDAKYTEKAFEYLFDEFLKKEYPGISGPEKYDKLTPAIFERILGERVLKETYKKLAPQEETKPGGTPPEPTPPGEIPRGQTPPVWKTLTKAQKLDVINDGKPADYLDLIYKFPRWVRDIDQNTRIGTYKYDDDELANALFNATEVPAHTFGARGVPGVMRVIEVLGIEQARKWGCCTLNEFRLFLGLRPYKTFEEWNPNKDVAAAARKLYRTPDNLELYVGLVSEESKEVMDGAGLCPSYTMSRAILADAVALVRGDRFLTYDATPFNLTTWGFFDGNRNTGNASWGGVLGKLFARTLPRNFNATSALTHFPLILPTGHKYSMDKILAKLGQAKEYTFTRPVKRGKTILRSDPNTIFDGLGKPEDSLGLITQYAQKIKNVDLSPSYLTVIDKPVDFSRVTKLVQDIFVPASELDALGDWFYKRTIKLITDKSYTVYKGGPKSVDIVKDVLRLVPVHWGAVKVAGLPVKTESETRGIYYEQQIYQMLKEIYTYIYVEGEATLEIPNQREARENVIRLRRFVKLSLAEARGTLPSTILGGLTGFVFGDHNPRANPVLKRLLNLGSPINEIANDVLAVISTASIELSQIFTHVVNFYLVPDEPGDDEDESEDEKAQKLKEWKKKEELHRTVAKVASTGSDPTSIAILEGYVREALRLDPVVPGVYRVATNTIPVGPLQAEPGTRFYFDFAKAGKDVRAFENHEEIKPDRPAQAYSNYHGDGVFKTLGEKFVIRVAAQVLRAVFSKTKIERTTGIAGTLRRYLEPVITVDDKFVNNREEVPFERVDEKGNPAKTDWTIPVNKYELVPAEPKQTADRWSYLDPETGHQPSTWATGLTLTYE